MKREQSLIVALLVCALLLPAVALADEALIADIDTLCRRVAMHRISTWSQPVYQSARWRTLTIRADAGDAKAFCEMAKLMQHYRAKLSCPPSFAEELRGRCTQ